MCYQLKQLLSDICVLMSECYLLVNIVVYDYELVLASTFDVVVLAYELVDN